MATKQANHVVDITLTEQQVARLTQSLTQAEEANGVVWDAVKAIASEQYALIREIDKPRAVKAAELVDAMLEPAYAFQGDVTYESFRRYVTRAVRILVCGGSVAGKAYADLDELAKAANATLGLARKGKSGKREKSAEQKVDAAAPDFFSILKREIKKQAFRARLGKELNALGYMLTPRMSTAAEPMQQKKAA